MLKSIGFVEYMKRIIRVVGILATVSGMRDGHLRNINMCVSIEYSTHKNAAIAASRSQV